MIAKANTSEGRGLLDVSGMPSAKESCFLLVTTVHGMVPTRLAIRLRDLGCTVHVWCPADHPATKTRAVSRCHPATVLGASASLRRAMETAAPDFVIPCDDAAARLMHELHATLGEDEVQSALRRLIAYSLGEPASCQRVSTRDDLMVCAERAGVAVPTTWVISSQASIRQWAEQIGFPAIVKINGSWGGMGVVPVQNIDQARAAFRRATRPSWRAAIAALLMRRHSAALLRLIRGQRPVVTMQRFVQGQVVSRSVACWQGAVLAGTSTSHLKSEGSTGPATVVRATDCIEIERASERLIQVFAMSGLCGLDFIVESGTGIAYLLEINPRATTTCHLVFDSGRDLARALLARIVDHPLPATSQLLSVGTVALFPAEWRRNPRSSYLRGSMHDVPWSEPELIRDCMGTPWPKRGLVARGWKRVEHIRHWLRSPAKPARLWYWLPRLLSMSWSRYLLPALAPWRGTGRQPTAHAPYSSAHEAVSRNVSTP